MGDLFKQLSEDIAGVVADAGASVVRVDARRRMSASGIAWSADGVIVTANHAVTRPENITIGTAGGETVAASVVGYDPTTDIAVLHAEGAAFPEPRWVGPDEVRVGQIVLGLARPYRNVQASFGGVSALGRDWRTGAGGRIDAYLRPDIVMYPGFSGGPLVGADGSFLGMLTSAFQDSLVIPALTLQRVVGALLTHGRVRRGYLGVGIQPVRLPQPLQDQLKQRSGLLVTSVEPGTAAEAAKVIIGDILVEIADAALRRPDDLLAALGEQEIGADVSLQLVRGGKLTTIPVKVGERPAPAE